VSSQHTVTNTTMVNPRSKQTFKHCLAVRLVGRMGFI